MQNKTQCFKLLKQMKRSLNTFEIIESYFVADGLKALVKNKDDTGKYVVFIKAVDEKDITKDGNRYFIKLSSVSN